MINEAWNYLDGKKTYIGLALGLLVLSANYFGVPLPHGLTVDQSELGGDLYKLVLAATIRHGIG